MASNVWIRYKGSRYLIGSDGAMRTGWQLVGGKWYYAGGDGAMKNGWQYLGWSGGRNWFYFDANGAMLTGWQYLGWSGGRNWFYFDANGAMLTGWQKLGWSGGSNWFYFDSNGKMLTGWQQLKWSGGTDYFYFDTKNGAMAANTIVDGYKVDANGVRGGKSTSGNGKTTTTTTNKGWVLKSGRWYYYQNGKAVTGWQYLGWSGGSSWFFFDSNGKMVTGWQQLGWSGKTSWYYFDTKNGNMVTGWQYLSRNGSRSWFYFNRSGAMLTGWQYLGWSGGTNWFYFDSNGRMLTGWQQLKWSGGKDYFYFNSGSGAMAVNTTVDGYTVDANGVRGGSEVDMASVIANTKTAQKTNQIIVVAGHNLTLWKKSGNDWVKSMDTYCGYGKGGFISAESHSENTTRSPIGSYPILFAFGTSSNPGTSMTYRNVTSKSYWSAERSTYNTWVESSTKIRGEHLADYYQYKYAMAVGFNTNPTVYGKGSAIFVHCKSTNSWDTGGCISLSESDMVELLKETGNGAYIIMVPDMASVANW